MKGIKDAHSLFKIGGRPSTNLVSVNSEGVVNELLWLDTEFTHCYGIDRLWLKNDWMDDSILLYICKQSGGDINIFERVFYDTTDPNKDTGTLVSIEESLPLFTTMKHWVQSKEYFKLIDLLKSKPDAVYRYLIFDYLDEHQLQDDLEKLIRKLWTISPKDKLFIEISF